MSNHKTNDTNPSTFNDDTFSVEISPQTGTSTLNRQLSSIAEVSSTASDLSTPDVVLVTPVSRPSSTHDQRSRRSTGVGPYERQLSLLDPMSDRVSTILVWRNLTV